MKMVHNLRDDEHVGERFGAQLTDPAEADGAATAAAASAASEAGSANRLTRRTPPPPSGRAAARRRQRLRRACGHGLGRGAAREAA